jgi:hypothetical protein
LAYDAKRQEREVRRRVPEEGEAFEEKSGMEGRDRNGGTKIVNHQPEVVELPALSIDKMVRIEPAIDRECVMEDESGIAIGRLMVSLHKRMYSSRRDTAMISSLTYQIRLTHFCRSNTLSAASLSTPSAHNI